MALIHIEIDFKRYTSHPQLVSDLSPAFAAQVGDTVNFSVHLNTYYKTLYSDFLMLVTSAVIYLRKSGIEITGHIHCDEKDPKTQYASRVNFFNLLGLEYSENFTRRTSAGKFTELTPYNKENIKDIFEQIFAIIISNVNIVIEVKQLLYCCLYEIMDNVLNHSAFPKIYEGDGWCCAQYFPSSDELRIIICDTGVGIHTALTKHPKSIHQNKTEKEALELCTQKGVTNSEGMGFGLFATAEFIKENGGEMIIYSGNHFSNTLEGTKSVYEGDYWQGTFVYMKINTQISVDYKRIMPDGHTLPDDYQFFLEKSFGFNDDLW